VVRFLLSPPNVIRITLIALVALVLASIAGPGMEARSAPAGEDPVVTVYGADGDPWTEKMLDSLRRSGLPFVYKIHDETQAEDELQSALQAAGATRCCQKGCQYRLPVVTVDAMLMLSPKPSVVKQAYLHAS